MLLPASLLALASATFVAGQGNPTAYAPTTKVQCPTDPLLRVFTPQNQTLHPQEQAFVTSKDSQVLPDAWTAWIGNASQIGYNSSSFGGKYARVGIAVSGGGYRAAQYGAGVMSALDARNASAKSAGTGGLLQVATYWSGLSGSVLRIPHVRSADARRWLVADRVARRQRLADHFGFGVRQ